MINVHCYCCYHYYYFSWLFCPEESLVGPVDSFKPICSGQNLYSNNVMNQETCEWLAFENASWKEKKRKGGSDYILTFIARVLNVKGKCSRNDVSFDARVLVGFEVSDGKVKYGRLGGHVLVDVGYVGQVVNLGTFVLNSNNNFMMMVLKVVKLGTLVPNSNNNNFMMMLNGCKTVEPLFRKATTSWWWW